MSWFISAFIKGLGFLLSLLPRQLIRKSGSWLGFLWFDIFKIRRKVMMDNLTLAFPQMSEVEKNKLARESIYNFAYNAAELLTTPHFNQKWLDENVIVKGWENVEKARAQGKGMFFLTLHLGNGDVASSVVVMKGQEMFLITKRFKTKWFDDLWFSIRGAQGVQYIDAHAPNNAFEILKVLKKNASVAFVLDQFMGKPFGIATKFFGHETGTAYGLALFVQKTKTPVLPIYTYEGVDKKMYVVIEPEMNLSKCYGESKDQTTLQMTQTFNDKLEEIVRKHPDQWMWVHRRWKNFENP